MNPKLKSILQTTWNEPRHFFFWLATITLSALMVIAIAAGSGLSIEVRPWFLVILGLGGCFTVSVLAFVLAWIPIGRRFLSWLLARRVLTLAALATLVALFYAVENWRGWRAWQTYKRHAEAKGERFDMAGIIPAPVPGEQNFFETPLWNDMHFVASTNSSGSPIIWSDTNWGNRVFFGIAGPRRGRDGELGKWRQGQRLDLAGWQAFYRGTNNIFAAANGSTSNYFPISAAPQTAAADVLLALSRFEGDRQVLVESSHRPYGRFWINYDAGYAALLPHLSRVKLAGQYLCLHSEAARQNGDKQTAMEDFRLSLRLMDAIGSEPIIVSHLVRIAMLDTALQPLWQGIVDRQWTESELKVLESELRSVDFLRDYHLAIRGERAFNLSLVDYIQSAKDQHVLEVFVSMTQAPRSSEWPADFLVTVAPMVPRGWFDQNKLALCRMHDTYLLPAVDPEGRVVRRSLGWQTKEVQSDWIRPYDMFSSLLLPALEKTPPRFAQGQVMTDLARVACAVERYRLARGQPPEDLAKLVPEFLEQMPHDVITGEPLKYRPVENGRFLLYSVGWNATDDGGKPGVKRDSANKGDWEQDNGDWVWRFPEDTSKPE